MNKIFILLFIGVFLYSGITVFLIAFGLKIPKFKTFEQQVRFETIYKKYHLLLKIGAIVFLISFITTVIRSNVLNEIF